MNSLAAQGESEDGGGCGSNEGEPVSTTFDLVASRVKPGGGGGVTDWATEEAARSRR